MWWEKISIEWKKGDILIPDNMRERYEIIKDPIKGGMGVIYICKLLNLNLYYAFKGLNKKLIDTPDAEAKLKREAEIWLDLAKHPNIVTLRLTCDILNQKFLVMDAIFARSPRGNTLNSWMKTEKKLDIEKILNFSIQICNGMIHATKEYEKKGRKFIHGDLHPGNILIYEKSKNEAVLKITDFGLVKDKKTWSALGRGPVPYVPPERWKNSLDIDQRADIYSFGCMIYLMLTGHPPFNENSIEKYRQSHCSKEPDPPFENSEHKTYGVKELSEFVLKCLKKNPQERYFDFEECHDELARFYLQIFKKQVIIDENGTKMYAIDYLFRGIAYKGINHPKEAESSFRKVLEIDPNSANAWSNLGGLFSGQKRQIEAEDAFRKALEIDPNNANTLYSLGLHLLKQKRSKEAEDAFRKALKIDPKFSLPWNELGILLQKQNRINEAEKALRKALEIHPRDVQTWYNLGVLFQKQNRIVDAEKAWRKVVELDPKDAQAWYELGILISDQNRPKEAEDAYKKSLKIDPKNAPAWNNLGVLLVKQNRIKEAEYAYRKALKVDPNDAKTWNNLGLLLYSQKRLKEAEKVWRKVVEIDPKYAKGWHNLGSLFMKQNRMKEAEEAYKKVIELDPKDAKIRCNLGFIFQKQNLLIDAEEAYRKTIEIDPKNAFAWNNLGNLFAHQNRMKEAVNVYYKILEIDPYSIKIRYVLGNLLVKQQRFKEAEKIYQEILTLTHNDPRALYKFALFYAFQSKVSESVKYLKLAIDKFFKCKEMARTDKNFDLIRDTPEFRELLK